MRRGFTVVELLVVLGVGLVLAVILFPVFFHPREGHSYISVCMSNQRQLTIGLLSFGSDGNQDLSLPPDWVTTSGLVVDPKLFDCPSSPRTGTPAKPDYGMNAALFNIDRKTGGRVCVSLRDIADPASTELLSDITGPTGVGSKSNPFPGSYTISSYFGGDSNAAWCHNKRIIATYIDGHVALLRQQDLSATGRTRYSIPLGTRQEGGK